MHGSLKAGRRIKAGRATPRQAMVTALLIFLLGICGSRAGGPLRFDGSGRPYVFNLASGPVSYRVDSGNLGLLNHLQAVALVDSCFKAWADTPTAAIAFRNAGPIQAIGTLEPININRSNFGPYYSASYPLGQNIVVFDEDGSIFELLFGSDSLVLGFAAISAVSDTPSPTIVESLIFLNGGAIDGNPNNGELNSVQEFAGTITHEIGHFIGLGHSQLNGLDFRTIPPEAIETMHPILRNGVAQATLHKDDMIAVSTLYPRSQLTSSYGTLEGAYYESNGLTPFTGANMVLRNIADPLMDAVSLVSGETYTPAGRYIIHGLTPGAKYTLRVEPISVTFTGASGVGPSGWPTPLPGPIEYYNGARESGDPAIDNPDDYTLLTAEAGKTLEPINIIANRFVGTPPEVLSVQANLSQDDPLALIISVSGRDADGDVEKIILDLVQNGSQLVGSRDASLTAFGISLAKQKEFRFSIYAGDCISQQSIRRFLPKSNSVTIRLIDHEGRISIPVTQGIGKANSASRLIFPSLLWSDTTSTGVALVNLLTDTVLNTFCYFDNSGNLLATGSNPASRSLFPGRQTAFFANEVLNAGPSSDGWLEVRSSADKLAGFFLEGDFAKGTYLDGTSAATEGIRQSYLPVILLSGGKSQQFLVVNPEPNAAQVTLRAFKSTGEMVYSTLKAIPVHGRISESLTSLLSAAGAGIIDGYLEVQANQPVSTLSKISTADALAMFAGMTPAPGNRLCGVQFATGQEYQTYLNLINTGNTASTVALTLRNADGTALATKSDLRISAKGSLQAEVGALFGLPLLSGRLYQGWLTIDFGSEAIIGLSTVAGRGPGSFITSLPLIATFQKQYVLPHVAMLDGYYTGLGLLNPDSLRATLRIQVFDQAGQMTGQSLLSLEPGQRDARLLEQLVSGLRPQNRGYVLLDSDRNIGVVGVFGSTRLDLLSTIPAIPR